MHDKIRNRILGGWARFVCRHPWWVLLVATLLTAASVLVTLRPIPIPGAARTLGPLGFQSNRNDLISKKLEWNKHFIDWLDHFTGTNDYILIVDAGPDAPPHPSNQAAATQPTSDFERRLDQFRSSATLLNAETPGKFLGAIVNKMAEQEANAPSPSGTATQPTANHSADPQPAAYSDRIRRTEALVDELGRELSKSKQLKRVIWGFERSKVSPRAVRLDSLEPMADQPDEADTALQDLQQLGRILHAFTASINNPTTRPTDVGSLIVDPAELGWEYLRSPNHRLYFIRITPADATKQNHDFAPSIAEVRRIMAEASAHHPGIELGLTGIDVVETDETGIAEWDGTWTGILSAAAIALLLSIAFHSIRGPLLIVMALAYAIAWTFGFTTIVIGHLQVLSVVFTSMLLGLGIAYGIYLASRFEIIRADYPDTDDGFASAMADCFQTMGPGITTGAGTTALAFATTVFTKFIGVAEMGLISAVGIVFCYVSMFSVFPALYRIFKPRHRHIRSLEDRRIRFFDDRWVGPIIRHPYITLAVAAVLTLASVISFRWMHFQFNLLELQARGVNSVQWERRIVTDGDESIWFGVSIVNNLPEARERAAQFRAMPTVATVRGVGLLFPADESKKLRLLADVSNHLGKSLIAATQPADPDADSPHAVSNLARYLQIGMNTALRKYQVPPAIRGEMAAVLDAATALSKSIDALPSEEAERRMARLQNEYRLWRHDSAVKIQTALDPAPLGFDDLPPEVMEPYRSDDGRYSLEIVPNSRVPGTGRVVDALSPEFLPRFTSDLRVVDPNVTGVVMQIYKSGDLIYKSYLIAGAVAFGIVFIFVLVDFRTLNDAIFSLVPVAIGFAITFGLMTLIHCTWPSFPILTQINAANIIVLPLMFGIGVDSGVHIIYRNRMDPHGSPPGLTQGTAKGIVIVNLATLMGFGVLMFASHRGIQSLGFVLTIGMAMTLLSCMTVMPAWLQIRRNHRKQSTPPIVGP